MTQEFHLSVTPVGDDEYLVRTERVEPGVPLGEEQVRWSADAWLAQARQLMNDPLLGLLQGDGLHPLANQTASPDQTQSLYSLVELGQDLYRALFQGTLRDSWVTAQGIAQHRGEVLRLRLGLKGPRLPRLPWEVMYSTDVPIERLRQSGSVVAARPLATGTLVIFSRYQPNMRLIGDAPHIEPDQPLRILMVIAAPDDRERLELVREANQLQQELRASSAGDRLIGSAPEIQLTVLNQPGREELTQALEQGQYQVLHYAGHSDLSSAGGSLYLVNRRTGLSEVLNGDDLAGLLVNNGIRLAVFNSCRGSYTAASDPINERERNLAEALIGRGIPAVLAMAEQIPDNVALILTSLFYRNLKQGYPIDLSLSRARQGLISAYGSHQLYWALPILYLHPDFDGYLIGGERSASDPGDRMLLLPQNYPALPALAGETALTSLNGSLDPEDEAMVLNAVLIEEDPSDWLDDLDLDDAEDDEEDASVVADLLQQLAPNRSPQPSTSPVASASNASLNLAAQASGATHQPTARQSSQSIDRSTGSKTRRSNRNSRRRGQQRPLLPWLAAGTVGLVLLGVFLLPRLHDLRLGQPTTPGTSPTAAQQIPPEQLLADATQHFNQKEFAAGEKLVATLLDRNALKEAAAALAAVPAERANAPSVSFLKGRLIWQSAKAGDANANPQEARRLWEDAASRQPKNPDLFQALGFAYYNEGRLEEAKKAFSAAIFLRESESDTAGTEVSTGSSATSQAKLMNYAGLALTLWKDAANNGANDPQGNLSKARKAYQLVLSSSGANFQPQNLNQNWLWNQSMVQDWQSLSQTQ